MTRPFDQTSLILLIQNDSFFLWTKLFIKDCSNKCSTSHPFLPIPLLPWLKSLWRIVCPWWRTVPFDVIRVLQPEAEFGNHLNTTPFPSPRAGASHAVYAGGSEHAQYLCSKITAVRRRSTSHSLLFQPVHRSPYRCGEFFANFNYKSRKIPIIY